MEKVKITKEEIDRIMKVKGRISGAVFKEYYHFILERKGEKGVREVEKRLKELGYSINFKKASTFKWYPMAFSCVVLLVVVEVFGEDISVSFDIGYEAPSYSLIAKLLMKYVSIEKIVKESQKYWRKYIDLGNLKCADFNKEKKYTVMRLENFRKFHEVTYAYIKGFFVRIFEMVTKSKNVKIEQTKSLFKNDPYDEFKINWG